MNKIYEVAILGVGARGGDTYGRLINEHAKDKFKIVSLCDKRENRLERFSAEFGVEKSNCFMDENEFFKKKRVLLCFRFMFSSTFYSYNRISC